ncbi:MAG: AAA family ATPase [Clostridia bacterium]|nr:AAA family ATPase [Clostridia bacterium]
MIGGTMGVGKTTTCQILKNKLNNSVFLDGDWCWDMNPFKVTEETKSMVMNNIGYMLNSFIRCSEYDNIIFCWVMHEQSIIDNIINRLEIKNVNTYLISLMCSENSLKDRLEKDINNGIRTYDVTEKSVSRIPLYDKLNTIKIDVSEISAEDAAEKIKEISFKQTLSMRTV